MPVPHLSLGDHPPTFARASTSAPNMILGGFVMRWSLQRTYEQILFSYQPKVRRGTSERSSYSDWIGPLGAAAGTRTRRE